MQPRLRLAILVLVAIEVVADVVGLLVVVLPIAAKQDILTVVLALTLLWDVGSIVALFVFTPLAPVGGAPHPYTEARRRHGVYWGTIAAALTIIALYLVRVPMGIPVEILLLVLGAFLALITASDVVASYQLLR